MNILARILMRICMIPLALAVLAMAAVLVVAMIALFAVMVPFICLFGSIKINGRNYKW